MTKPKKTSEIKYFFILFIFLILYAFTIVNGFGIPKVEGVMYAFHCVDYGLGFCSRFLPGSVYRLFFAEPSEFTATVFELILLICFFAVLSFYLTKLISKTDKENRRILFTVIAFYVSGSCTFAAFSKNLGMLDVYWVFFAVIFIALLQNRYSRLLLPVIGALSVAVHFGALISYVPFFALMILYELSQSKDKKDKTILGISFAMFCIFSIAAFAYFSVYDSENIKCNIDEFYAIMSARGVGGTNYFSYLLYGNGKISAQHFTDMTGIFELLSGGYFTGSASPSGSSVIDTINTFINQISLHIFIYSVDDIYTKAIIEAASLLLLLSPVLFIMYRFIIKRMKSTCSKTEKFVYFCMLVFLPLCCPGSILISTDSVRWLTHIYISLFSLILYMVYKEKENVLNIIKDETERFNPYLTGAYFIIYAFTIYDPYV